MYDDLSAGHGVGLVALLKVHFYLLTELPYFVDLIIWRSHLNCRRIVSEWAFAIVGKSSFGQFLFESIYFVVIRDYANFYHDPTLSVVLSHRNSPTGK
jgi:hypothetical protein